MELGVQREGGIVGAPEVEVWDFEVYIVVYFLSLLLVDTVVPPKNKNILWDFF